MSILTNQTSHRWTGTFDYLKSNQILVFGSNPEGHHGKGAAKLAMKFGAEYGNGFGPQGQTFALCTKNLTPNIEVQFMNRTIAFTKAGERSVAPSFIAYQIRRLYEYALDHPEWDFLVIYANRKSLCGYTSKELAQMFDQRPIPKNVYFHEDFPIQLDL